MIKKAVVDRKFKRLFSSNEIQSLSVGVFAKDIMIRNCISKTHPETELLKQQRMWEKQCEESTKNEIRLEKELKDYKKKVIEMFNDYCKDCNWLLDIKYCIPKKCKIFSMKEKLKEDK